MPLELIVNNDDHCLRLLKVHLEKERRLLVAKMAVKLYGNPSEVVTGCPVTTSDHYRRGPSRVECQGTPDSDCESDATDRSDDDSLFQG